MPEAIAALRDPQRVVDIEGADALVLHVAQLVLLILCAWCALGAVLMALTAARSSDPMRRVADRLLPAGSQRMLAAALGIGVLSLTACAQPGNEAAPMPSTTPLYAASADAFDWSVAPDGQGATAPPSGQLDTPAATETPQPPGSELPSGGAESSSTATHDAGSQEGAAGSGSTHEHVVAAGDSLWSIAAAHLGPGHTPAEVAYLVDELYQTNQSAIGANPDLLSIGAQLIIPA